MEWAEYTWYIIALMEVEPPNSLPRGQCNDLMFSVGWGLQQASEVTIQLVYRDE